MMYTNWGKLPFIHINRPRINEITKKDSFEHDVDVAEAKEVFCRLRRWIA